MILLLTEGQVSDYRGAERMLPALPDANTLLADRGYDSNWFREALAARDIEPCIPGRKNRKEPIEYDTELYKQRNRIERMFGRLIACLSGCHPQPLYVWCGVKWLGRRTKRDGCSAAR